MRIRKWVLAAVVAAGLSNGAEAGIFFNRKPKPNPAEAVPALIMQLKTDKDDGRRANAAEELRNFDPKANPEIHTVLVDALLKDSSPAVRAESATTLSKLRPINHQAGFALEQAAAHDPAIRVRMAARQSLWQYNLLGYRSGKGVETADGKKGPQLLPPPGPQSAPHVTLKPRGSAKESPEPPLAGESSTSLKPVAPPKLMTPPPTTDQQGPKLNPPG